MKKFMSASLGDEEKDRQFATTLARGLEILQCFKPGQALLANKEFVAAIGLDKATVSRLTFTLTRLGYLRHDTQLGRYRLGSPVLSMGYPLLASMHIRHIARPLMTELADRVQGTVAMGIRDRTAMVYVETVRAVDGLTPSADIGVSLPLVASAIGHAWLAGSPLAERQRVLNQVKVKEPALYAAHTPAVEQALRDFQARGFCVSKGLLGKDRYAAAVPVARPVDSEIVVFNCSVASHDNSLQMIQRELGPRLVTLVRSVEIALGLH